MATSETYSLLVLSAQLVLQLTRRDIEGLYQYFEPDGVLLIRDGEGQHVVARTKWDVEQSLPDEATLITLDDQAPESVSTDAGTLLFVLEPPTHNAIKELLPMDGSEVYVFTDAVSVSVDLDSLTAGIEGLSPFQNHESPLTVFSGRLEADYWVVRESVSVRGLAPVRESNTKVPCLTLGSDGIVTTKTLAKERLGIRALNGLGETTANRLRNAGFHSLDDIHDATMRDIRKVKGVGNHRAETFKKQARSIVVGEVVRLSDDETLPRDVVHIDIETDGLTPTIIWQIGLYDPRADDFRTFLQKDPSDKTTILREFGSWLRSNLDGRVVVAYNGWEFDFEQLTRFFAQHCLEYHEVWQKVHKFDPYDWAVRRSNAALPGRGNGLEEVAASLGYDREDTSLDGATTAHQYQRWMQNPCEETELDWDRHSTYCREDVMGLNHVYECLLDSTRLQTTDTNMNRPTDENTTQETLFDY